MDSQAQLQRTHGQHQAEEPIRIHHLEEKGDHEKGPAKVLKKVKEKAKKIKKALTKHGHGHEHDRGEHIPDDHDLDEEDDEDDYEDQEHHGGAPGIRNLEGFDPKAQERGDAMHQPNQSSASVTSVVADKAAAAKNAVASKLGYSEDGGHENRVEGEQTPSSGSGYGNKVAGMVTPVYEKVKETGASVMTKLPFSGGGTGTETETQQEQDKGVSAREYLTEKLSPGEEDKALSEVVAEKLHLGGGENTAKKGTVTQSEEVEKRLGGFSGPRSEGEMKHGEAFAEEGEGGMVEKLREAVTSWVSGTTEEVMQKSTESVQDSSQSVGATVDGAGQRSGGKSDSVPVQKKSGN